MARGPAADHEEDEDDGISYEEAALQLSELIAVWHDLTPEGQAYTTQLAEAVGDHQAAQAADQEALAAEAHAEDVLGGVVAYLEDEGYDVGRFVEALHKTEDLDMALNVVAALGPTPTTLDQGLDQVFAERRMDREAEQH